MSLRVVLAGGGTAGHVEPALAVADALRRADPATEITALGTARGLETRLVPARGYPLALIPPVPLPRRPTPALLTVPTRLAGAVREAGEVLRRTRADVLVGFGGYVALPGYLAARRAGVPVVVHEANARPGLANRIGARWAVVVATATADVPLRGARPVGIPLRSAVSSLDRPARRAEALAAFGLSPDHPTLLVFGGSQGARRLNQALPPAARALAEAGVQVLHAAGPGNAEAVAQAVVATGGTTGEVRSAGGPPPYRVVPYLDRMDLAYAAADLAVCRAGAMTCAELAAVGLPGVYVPLPIGNGEQRLNAGPVVRAGGGLLVDDAALTPDEVRRTVVPLAADRDRLAAMGRAAASFGTRHADERLAELVVEAAGTRRSAR